MNTSLDWLNQYLDRPCGADEAEQVLTSAGFPLDGREDVALSSGHSDVALDVEITSNRSDCLSHVGLARELAAGSGAGEGAGRSLQLPDMTLPKASGPAVAELTSVANEQDPLCPLYTARVIRGVKIGPSPPWLVDRLEAVGLRSVNNVVDVTNYVLLELGQPLHAFDLDRLHERRIVVRRARKGELFVAIDGSRHELRDDMLVIADADRPVAVAGVMGGQDSEVSEGTTDILLESAMFDQLSVRTTSRALKLASDSSYRFERGVDPLGVERASARAVQLILELAGGELAEGQIRVGRPDPAPLELTLRPQRCNALLGIELSAREQAGLLDRLGLNARVEGGDEGRIHCTVPIFRLDLRREVDLIEEVARLHGLNAIPMRRRIEIEARPVQPEVAARRLLGQVLAAHGYHETITFSLVRPEQARPFIPAQAESGGPAGGAVALAEAGRRAEPMLRPAVLPSLLICRKANQDLGNADVRLFEAAAAWWHGGEYGHGPDTIAEQRQLAMLADAEDGQRAVRELRGTIEELVERLGGQAAHQALRFEPLEPVEQANYEVAAAVSLGEQRLGMMGLLSASVRDVFEVKTPVAGAELELGTLLALYPPQRQVGELPRFPAIERDLSVLVDEQVAWRQIEQVVKQTNPAMLEAVRFIGTYRGKPIPAGRKSVSFRMVFRDPAKTLRHEEVDPQIDAVVEALKQAVDAELRG